jgi:putative SOS response-associated peptidase YedK
VCGRVVATASRDELVGLFGVEAVVGPELAPTYNAAPEATLYAVAETGRGRSLGSMRWGFVPSWSASPRHGPRPINARVESLLNKRMFSEALDHRTCLIPVDGFYERQDGPDGKQPFLLQAPDRSLVVLAGLWSRWSAHGCDAVTTFAIVTCPANQDVAPLHDRMPVLLPREHWGTWLDRSDADAQQRLGLLRPAHPGSLKVMEVSRRVNDARNDGPELLSA